MPKLAVVPDLNEIVDLTASLNDRRAEYRAIDRRARADLDLVLQHNVAVVINFNVLARFGMRVAEAVASDDGVCVDYAALADDRVIVDDGVCVDYAAVADMHVITGIRAA